MNPSFGKEKGYQKKTEDNFPSSGKSAIGPCKVFILN